MKTRYEKVKEIIESVRPEDRRMCPSKSACACKGCVSSKGVKEYELKLYFNGKL